MNSEPRPYIWDRFNPPPKPNRHTRRAMESILRREARRKAKKESST